MNETLDVPMHLFEHNGVTHILPDEEDFARREARIKELEREAKEAAEDEDDADAKTVLKAKQKAIKAMRRQLERDREAADVLRPHAQRQVFSLRMPTYHDYIQAEGAC